MKLLIAIALVWLGSELGYVLAELGSDIATAAALDWLP
jgi:hypothetical protein